VDLVEVHAVVHVVDVAEIKEEVDLEEDEVVKEIDHLVDLRTNQKVHKQRKSSLIKKIKLRVHISGLKFKWIYKIYTMHKRKKQNRSQYYMMMIN
jgi:hypothetical protein